MCLVTNPKSIDCQCPRKSLIPGALKTLRSNLTGQLPIHVFELGDVVHLTHDKGNANNQRSLVLACMRVSSNFDFVHGCLDFICGAMDVQYSLKHSEEQLFIKNRGVDVLVNGEVVGVMGIVHPWTLEKFEVT